MLLDAAVLTSVSDVGWNAGMQDACLGVSRIPTQQPCVLIRYCAKNKSPSHCISPSIRTIASSSQQTCIGIVVPAPLQKYRCPVGMIYTVSKSSVSQSVRLRAYEHILSLNDLGCLFPEFLSICLNSLLTTVTTLFTHRCSLSKLLPHLSPEDVLSKRRST